MKFTISKSELLEALQIVSKGISARSTLPILSGFYIQAINGKLLFQSTDLEISIKHEVEAFIEEEGEVIVPGKYFFEIVKNLNDAAVSCWLEDNQVKLSCLDSLFSLNTLNVLDFPSFPNIQTSSTIKISLDILLSMVKKVSKAASKDETRAVLTGIFFMVEDEIIRMVATDSYRLAIVEKKISAQTSENFKLIIPGSIFDEVVKLAAKNDTISIGYTDNQIIFMFGSSIIVTRKIEGNYPNYQQIIPKDKTVSITVNVKALISSIKRASIMVQDHSPLTFFIDSDANLLIISSHAQEIGGAEEKISIECEGETLEIGFNSQYIIDGLQVIESEEVVFEAQSSLKPGVFKTVGDEKFFYLTMPVRLNK